MTFSLRRPSFFLCPEIIFCLKFPSLGSSLHSLSSRMTSSDDLVCDFLTSGTDWKMITKMTSVPILTRKDSLSEVKRAWVLRTRKYRRYLKKKKGKEAGRHTQNHNELNMMCHGRARTKKANVTLYPVLPVSWLVGEEKRQSSEVEYLSLLAEFMKDSTSQKLFKGSFTKRR